MSDILGQAELGDCFTRFEKESGGKQGYRCFACHIMFPVSVHADDSFFLQLQEEGNIREYSPMHKGDPFFLQLQEEGNIREFSPMHKGDSFFLQLLEEGARR